MPECPKCNKKFHSQDALIQHLNDKKDEKHRLHDNKNESQSENSSTPKIYPRGRPGIYNLGKMLILKNKPNLTETEKIELDELTKWIEEDHKREAKRLNIKFGLPEDTPVGESHRLQRAESELKLKESQRKLEESRKKTREMNRESRKRTEEFKRKIEQMDKDAWKAHEQFRAENPNLKYVETTPIKTEENIECSPCKSPACPPPLKNKAKKNKLLQMSTG
jgi:hypothetical protein